MRGVEVALQALCPGDLGEQLQVVRTVRVALGVWQQRPECRLGLLRSLVVPQRVEVRLGHVVLPDRVEHCGLALVSLMIVHWSELVPTVRASTSCARLTPAWWPRLR